MLGIFPDLPVFYMSCLVGPTLLRKSAPLALILNQVQGDQQKLNLKAN